MGLTRSPVRPNTRCSMVVLPVILAVPVRPREAGAPAPALPPPGRLLVQQLLGPAVGLAEGLLGHHLVLAGQVAGALVRGGQQRPGQVAGLALLEQHLV